LQQAPPGVDHGAPELVEQQPGGLVAADAQLPLQLKGRDAVGVRGDTMRGEEPGLQRQVAAVHDRAGGHRGLSSARRAFPRRSSPIQRPPLPATAGRADKAVGPAAFGEIPGAGVVIGKPRLELLARHGTI